MREELAANLMEADWEIEVGGDAPVIDADWPGFVDLRSSPARVNEIAEARLQPGLTEALMRLNAGDSPVWTCKCDVFEPDRIDADEMDASREEAARAVACYVDLLMGGVHWKSLGGAEDACKVWSVRLREIALSRCRVDLVIRMAVFAGGNGLGVTAYLSACGRNQTDAESRLGECLVAFAQVAATQPK